MDTKVSVEETTENQKKILIEIPHKFYFERFDRLLGRAAQNANIKGFRPGKAPKAMIAKLYGQALQSDTVGEIVQEAYQNAVVKHELRVVGMPQIDISPIEAEKDVCVTALVELYPEPEIKNYFGVKCDVAVHAFTESSVDLELDAMREKFASKEQITKPRPAVKTDYLTIDFSAAVDGKPFKGSEGKDVVVDMGDGSLPPEFTAGLVGMSVGEEKTIQVKLPSDLGEAELAGKMADYRVALKNIQEKILPELNDEFVREKKLGESVKELREQVQKNVENHIEQQNKRAREEALFVAIAEKNTFRVPEVIVEEEIRSMLFELGFLNPNDKKSYKIPVTGLREQFGPQAEKRVRAYIVLQQIIRQEKLEIADVEVETWLETKTKEFDSQRSVMNKRYGYPDNIERIKDLIAREQMTALLLERATLSEKIKSPTDEGEEEGDSAEGDDSGKKKGKQKAKGKAKST